jgi:dGTPase
MQVKDVVTTTEQLVQSAGVHSADDVRRQLAPLVRYSPARRELNLELRRYLYQNVYSSPVVHGPNLRAVRMLEELFNYYLKRPAQIGTLSRKRIRQDGVYRAICDYLAGMTDRYAMQEYERLIAKRERK